jgi:predicted TPR repeat methyltransferase
MRTQGLENLEEMVLKGPPAKEYGPNLQNQRHWKEAVGYLGAYQRAGVGREAVEIARSLPEWPGFNKMLDLGGGAGMIGLYLVQAHPEMKGVLFDLPKVCENALPLIREYDRGMRMKVLAGDYNQDPLGEGYDLVWASLNLYYAQNSLDQVMAKIYQAMNPGGVFISYHEGLFNERVSPAFHVLGRIAPAFRGQDISFDQGEIANAMFEAGFAMVHSKTIASVNGPIDLDIARKKGAKNVY